MYRFNKLGETDEYSKNLFKYNKCIGSMTGKHYRNQCTQIDLNTTNVSVQYLIFYSIYRRQCNLNTTNVSVQSKANAETSMGMTFKYNKCIGSIYQAFVQWCDYSSI